jgi:spore maturation protein CgeB
MKYHADALGKKGENIDLLSRVASENIVVEALKHRADVVFIISAMALHPDAVWLLRRVGIRTTVLFTESPYNDHEQREFHAVYPEMRCVVNERTSAVDGWSYLAHAYDPLVHKPMDAVEDPCDVLLIGTLWRERIAFLEQVDWTGIKLKLIGTWLAPPVPEDSVLGQYYEEGCVLNKDAPGYYASAKICLNIHRAHPTAESLNPRAYELAACGAFQLTDVRAELGDVFGSNGGLSVASFDSPQDLEEKIRLYLKSPAIRQDFSTRARQQVSGHTFDARAQALVTHL